MIFMAKKAEKKEVNVEIVSGEVAIPEGTNVEVDGEVVRVKGPLGENTRKFDGSLLSVAKEGNKITVSATQNKVLRKKAEVSVNSMVKEISNDVNGVNKYFEEQMETVFLHFPIIMEAKGDTFTIKNIFGERKPRTARIVGSTKIEVKDKNVRIYGTSRDDVSQTAANIRMACKVTNKDVRVFQDGVYHSLE